VPAAAVRSLTGPRRLHERPRSSRSPTAARSTPPRCWRWRSSTGPRACPGRCPSALQGRDRHPLRGTSARIVRRTEAGGFERARASAASEDW